MEPVPETERMEQFRSSPVLSLRSTAPLATQQIPLRPTVDVDYARVQKPPNYRRCTDPSPTSPCTPTWSAAALAYRPRNTSPLAGGGGGGGGGGHTRSHSAASIAPYMSRTQSLPGVTGSGHLFLSSHLRRPKSPLQSPSRIRIPRKPLDEAFPPTSPVRQSVLDHDRAPIERSSSPNLALSGNSSRLRRPISPLRHLGGSPSILTSTPPSALSYRSYDAFTSSYGGSFSSVPSTPTSTRSRSPSISSLETIPDSPDAEEAALEAERIAQLKADAEEAENGQGTENKGRSSIDVPSGRGRTIGMGGFGTRDKRKRWSVCGAERRGDIDLETIWED